MNVVKAAKDNKLTTLLISLITIVCAATWHTQLTECRRKAAEASIKQKLMRIPSPAPCPVASPCPKAEVSVPNLSAAELRLHEMRQKLNSKEIWMGSIEIGIILARLRTTNKYLEWGSGGSTFNFPQFAKTRAISIEHNMPWCEKVRTRIASTESLQHLEYFCVEVKEVTKPGAWEGEEACHRRYGAYPQFKDYVDQIDKVGEELYDLILIDGRARVDCAIKSLAYISSSSVVVVHDASRIGSGQCYHSILKYYDAMDMYTGSGKQGITVLKRKTAYDYLQANYSVVQDILDKKYDL